VEVVNWAGRQNPQLISSRKLLHVAAGPVFLATWPWFTAEGKWWAALVPLCMTLKFALVGLGLIRDDKAVATMSRTGDRREILRGPLIYGCVFVAATVLAFRDLTAAVALAALCFGDAAAEVGGRRFGHVKLPWSPRKSYAGSAAFVVASLGAMTLFAVLFRRWGFAPPTSDLPLGAIGVAAIVGAVVESMPAADVDNFFVPLVVAATFHWATPA